MGHDIYAYDRENEPQQEIAYLRRSAWNEINKTIYLALDITERYGGVSGTNEGPVYFARKHLESAKASIPDKHDFQPEHEFLNLCLSHSGDGVWIEFL